MKGKYQITGRGFTWACSPEDPPVVMGILNLTPDSFSDGGQFGTVDAALRRTEIMLNEGAAVVDVGAESSRPRGAVYGAGAEFLDAESEKKRLIPVLEALIRFFPEAVFSVDTYKSDVGREALLVGAHILNDITGLRYDAELARVAAEFRVPLIVMHSTGTPGSLPHHVAHTDVMGVVKAALQESIIQAESAGVSQLIVDPGFGFGKTYAENLAILNRIPELKTFNRPVLVGISRKSTIGAYLGTADQPVSVSERLFGTLGATAVAVMRGASIVRTHDVGETVSFLRLLHETRSVA